MDVAELVLLVGGEERLSFPIRKAETMVGSHPTNDVGIPDPTLPAVVALIVDHGAQRYRLREIASHVVRVNGSPIEDDTVLLQDGDQLQLGRHTLRFRIRSQVEPTYRQTTILNEAKKSESTAVLSAGTTRYTLRGNRPFNIGSDDDNDLVLDDRFVSSFHCRISRENGRWILSDLDSTNGTMVNGLKVGSAELPSPATIKIGQLAMTFELETSSGEELEYFHGMIGNGPKIRKVFQLVGRLADAELPVLITGPSGSGKELVARALHDESKRAGGPFLAINCGALASSIIESELFGHVKDVFTGATSDRKGAFEATQGGTLFLDEIGELPLDLQPKLLRVLESSSIRRVGGTKEVPVDTRVVAATHRNLRELVEAGRFREDLFHRLYVLNVAIPPLSERPEDIVPIAEHFILTHAKGKSLTLTDRARDALRSYRWPGNVRELRNVILRAILLTETSELDAEAFEFSEGAFQAGSDDARERVRRADEAERAQILSVVEECGNNRAEAARRLGLSKSTFHDKLKRLGIPLKFRR